MEKIEITTVYLRGGSAAVIQGTEVQRDGDELYVYPDTGPVVTFNWSHVEFYKFDEVELPPENEIEEIKKKMRSHPVEVTDQKHGGLYL